jgi:hypothetical protein
MAALSKELAEIGADGVNGDTLDGIPQILATDSARAATLSRSSPKAASPPMK